MVAEWRAAGLWQLLLMGEKLLQLELPVLKLLLSAAELLQLESNYGDTL